MMEIKVGTIYKAKIGNIIYRIMEGNPVKGMIGKEFNNFDGMRINKRHAELWMPRCPEMDALWVKDGIIVDKQRMKPMTANIKTWHIYRTGHDHDYVIELEVNNNAKIGDKIEFLIGAE